MEIRNPRNGKYDYVLKVDDSEVVSQKSKALRSAQKQWQEAGLEYRISVLQKWFKSLQDHKDELIEQLSIDTGRKRIAGTETAAIMGLIQAWCHRTPQLMKVAPQRPSATQASVMVQQQWVPYRLVGVISPWNFPLLLALIDSIPALLSGAAVMLKPSEVTPRFMDPLEKSIQAVPELSEVFQLVRGGAAAGKAVVQHSDAICFTGSVSTGRLIAAACAERFIPAFLELGGNDPAIVLKDADLEIATDAILRSCVGATGQACQSLERIYVDETIVDDFVKMIVEKSKAVSLSTDTTEGQIGPLIFEQQAIKIQAQVDAAIADGARLHCGGKIENVGGGMWYRPTVLTNVNQSMEVMKDETFGPVIPIMPFATEVEAIELANDSIFGLSASVFSNDLENAIAIAAQIEAGAISINDGSLTNKVYDAEKNSFKQSGINGSRMGDAGFLRFFRKKALLIQKEKPEKI